MRRFLGCLALTAVVATGCTSGSGSTPSADFRPAAAPQVTLPVLDKVPGTVTIGLVVTGAGARGQGTEFAALAAGARVAEFRLNDRSHHVDLDVVDDRGTPDGAVAATKKLVDDGVAGIVYASAGSHLDPALAVAAAADTAVLLPYDTRADVDGRSSWRTGPSEQQVASSVRTLLGQRGLKAPLVFTGEGTGDELAALADPSRRVTLTAGDGLATQVTTAAAPLASGAAGAALVSASADTAAEAVAALQGQAPTAPVILGPSALAPAFADRLTELGTTGGATTAGQFLTVGPAVSDASTSEGAVDFLTAVRLAARDTDLHSLNGTSTFAQAGAATGDTRSHDAVLVLAEAAAKARSAKPKAVLSALRGLKPTGLAGPALSFSDGQALSSDGVAVLQATTRGPGRGVEEDAPALSWFVLPNGSR